ncbi:MAG: hypothetical protein II951_12815 [Bacteroidales bacterium]|nr:hypothetical protein [Bacteroidales bacterium]
MKALSVTQPWASLVIAGVRNIIGKPYTTDYRGTVLIVANSQTKELDSDEEYPAEWDMRISYAIETGSVESYDKMPLGAVLGYATLVDVIESSDEEPINIWDDGLQYQWKLENPVRFDYPILGAKARGKLFDIASFVEGNLPHGSLSVISTPSITDGVMSLTISEDALSGILETEAQGKDLFFWLEDLPEFRFMLYSDPDRKILKPISTIELSAQNATNKSETTIPTQRFEVSRYAPTPLLDDDGALVTMTNLNGDEVNYPTISFVLKCRNK